MDATNWMFRFKNEEVEILLTFVMFGRFDYVEFHNPEVRRPRRPQRQRRGCRSRPPRARLAAPRGRGQGWKVRSATDRTIRTFAHQNPGKILSDFRIFFTILQKFWKCWDLSTFSRKFGEIRRKKSSKSDKFSMKVVKKSWFFAEIRTKFRKSLTNFCEYFELGAVRRSVNLVDLEKCLKNDYLVAKNRLRCRRERAL